MQDSSRTKKKKKKKNEVLNSENSATKSIVKAFSFFLFLFKNWLHAYTMLQGCHDQKKERLKDMLLGLHWAATTGNIGK
jgi:hypothetical protein